MGVHASRAAVRTGSRADQRCTKLVGFCTMIRSVSSAAKNPLLDRLLAEKRITAQQRDAVIAYAGANHTRIEDALIESAALEEGLLLKWLAALHKTRFVSTEKLAKAEIDRSL